MNGLQRIEELPKLPQRKRDSHKGDFGRVLIVGGSIGMAGAPALAGLAALRGGAGLVRIACPESVLETVAGFEPCYMTVGLPEDAQGRIAPSAENVIRSLEFDVLAVGPGMSQSDSLSELLRQLMESVACPMVIDADALNLLARNTEPLARRRFSTILTPHPGEFSRLCGCSTAEVGSGRVGLAASFAQRHNILLVLKGFETVVTDGQRYAVNQSGNPGMATGGSGDVLTGVIAAMLAQGLDPWDAARLSVHLHGRAGDIAAWEKSEVSLIARDIVEALPTVVRMHGAC